jgi:hypothetical protein
VVIMNPMTTIEILREILDEQEEIYKNTLAWFELKPRHHENTKQGKHEKGNQ